MAAPLRAQAEALRSEIAGMERRRQELGTQLADGEARLGRQRQELAEIAARLARERAAASGSDAPAPPREGPATLPAQQ